MTPKSAAKLIIVSMLLCILMLFVGIWCGFRDEQDRSIKAGVAEYVLINPATGETRFQYKDIK